MGIPCQGFLPHQAARDPVQPGKYSSQSIFIHGNKSENKTALTADSTPVIKEMAICGAGLGLLPEFAIRKELIYHMLEKINYNTDFPVYTQLLMHPDKSVSKELRQFLEVAGRHIAPNTL